MNTVYSVIPKLGNFSVCEFISATAWFLHLKCGTVHTSTTCGCETWFCTDSIIYLTHESVRILHSLFVKKVILLMNVKHVFFRSRRHEPWFTIILGKKSHETWMKFQIFCLLFHERIPWIGFMEEISLTNKIFEICLWKLVFIPTQAETIGERYSLSQFT